MKNYETELLESLEREQEAFNILNETCENWKRNCMKLLKQYTELLIKNDDLVKENIELKALLSTYDDKYNDIEDTKKEVMVMNERGFFVKLSSLKPLDMVQFQNEKGEIEYRPAAFDYPFLPEPLAHEKIMQITPEEKAILLTYDNKHNSIEDTKKNATMTPDELELYKSGYDSAMEGYDPYVL